MSEETDNDDSIEEKDCRNCGRTDHKLMGKVPREIVSLGVDDELSTVSWVDADMCLSCGSISVKNIPEEKIQETVDDIVDLYEEHELASEEYIKSLKR